MIIYESNTFQTKVSFISLTFVIVSQVKLKKKKKKFMLNLVIIYFERTYL